MPDDRGTIRQVAWTEVFPWLELLRAFRLAIQVRLLVLASVAVLITFGGWWGAATLFSGSEDPALQMRFWNPVPVQPSIEEMKNAPLGFTGPTEVILGPGNPLVAAWYNLSAPFVRMFAADLSIVGLAFLVVCALWADLVWSFFGGLITRLVALQVARSERGSLRAAVRYVRSRYLAYVTAPLFPLFGVLLFALPLAVLGLIGQAGSGGLVALAVLWPLFLIAGLVIMIFLIGLLFGWPLMWPTISAEGTDSFDALSRSYSYVYQRPLHYAWFVVVASVLGALAGIVVQLFVATLLYVTAWGVSWGAGRVVLGDLTEAAPAAAHVLGFWTGLVQLLAVGFTYAYFFSAATIIYFLLRQEVDGTETDEVFLEEQADKFGLPPVTTDAAGVATIADAGVDDELAENGNGASTA